LKILSKVKGLEVENCLQKLGITKIKRTKIYHNHYCMYSN